MPFWQDLFIVAHTQEGIFYEIDGTAPTRQAAFEFYTTFIGNFSAYYHMVMYFYENRPGVVTFKYLNISDYGRYATVGVESSSGE